MTASITATGLQQAQTGRRAATEAALKFDCLLGALLGERSVPIEREAPQAPQPPAAAPQPNRKPPGPGQGEDAPEALDEDAAPKAVVLAPAPATHANSADLPTEAPPNSELAGAAPDAPLEARGQSSPAWLPEGELAAPLPATAAQEPAEPQVQPKAATQEEFAGKGLPQILEGPELSPLRPDSAELAGQPASEAASEVLTPQAPMEPFAEPDLSPGEGAAEFAEPAEPAPPAKLGSAAQAAENPVEPAERPDVSSKLTAETATPPSLEPEARLEDPATGGEPEPQDPAQAGAKPDFYATSPSQEPHDAASGPRLEKPAPVEAPSARPMPQPLPALPGAPQVQAPSGDAADPAAQESSMEPVALAPASSREGRVKGRRFAEARAENLGLRQVEVVQRFARQFALRQTEGETEARLLLSPPTLGSVKLTLRMEDGVLTGSAVAETAAARHLLQTHLPELQAALADQGLTLGRFDVSSDSGQESPRESGSSRPRPLPGEIEAEAPARMAARVVAGRVEGYL